LEHRQPPRPRRHRCYQHPAAASITIQSGDTIQVQGITTGSNDTLSITGGSLTVSTGKLDLERRAVHDGRLANRERLRR